METTPHLGVEFVETCRHIQVLQCRAIVPNSSARRASAGVLPSSAVSPHRSRHLLAPIDWGQSIYQQALQCRAIVPNSSARRATAGVLPSSAVSPHRSSHLLGPIDWGQSIYQQALQCRAIVPNSSARRASGGVLRFSAVCPTGHGTSWFRSIGDNRSTKTANDARSRPWAIAVPPYRHPNF
jgi:hypothetical protein